MMHHMLTRFIFALNAVSPPPRMMPLSHAIWYEVPTVVMASTSMNCREYLYAVSVSVPPSR